MRFDKPTHCLLQANNQEVDSSNTKTPSVLKKTGEEAAWKQIIHARC